MMAAFLLNHEKEVLMTTLFIDSNKGTRIATHFLEVYRVLSPIKTSTTFTMTRDQSSSPWSSSPTISCMTSMVIE